jgi:hypothetical protein
MGRIYRLPLFVADRKDQKNLASLGRLADGLEASFRARVSFSRKYHSVVNIPFPELTPF